MRTYTLKEAEAKLKMIKRKKRKDLFDMIFCNKVIISVSLLIIGIIACIFNTEDATGGFILICISIVVMFTKDYHFETQSRRKK